MGNRRGMEGERRGRWGTEEEWKGGGEERRRSEEEEKGKGEEKDNIVEMPRSFHVSGSFGL